jgi:serine/threonine-protein kinase BUR1
MQPGNGKNSPLSVYMVFPYMDHDLAGLLENERVKLQPSHIKLYMKQLLEGTEYMHRVRPHFLTLNFVL